MMQPGHPRAVSSHVRFVMTFTLAWW